MAYTRFKDMRSYVKFGSDHAYEKYGLVLKSYEVETPKRITNIINTPTKTLDITESVDSVPRYRNRNVTLSFKIIEQDSSTYSQIYYDFVEGVNGKVLNVFISDMNATYSGRVTVDKYKSNITQGLITVVINAEPTAQIKYEKKIDFSLYGGESQTITLDITLKVGDEILIMASSSGYKASVDFTDTATEKTLTSVGTTTFGKVTRATSPKITVTCTNSSTSTQYKRTVTITAKRSVIA